MALPPTPAAVPGLPRLLALFSAFLGGATLAGAQQLTPSFLAADGARNSMDVGEVWNGSSLAGSTTGDTFRLVISEPGAVIHYDVGVTVTLPPELEWVPSAVGGAATGASLAGNQLTLSLPPDTDVDASSPLTVEVGLRAPAGTAPGTYSVGWQVTFGTTDDASDGSASTSLPILVAGGASSLAITPLNQTLAIGDTASFQVQVSNTGPGGLFGVRIDESAIDPNPSGSLQLLTMVQSAPALAATGSAPVLTLPYLARGESFVVDVTALVQGCMAITNLVETDDLLGFTTDSQVASVTLAVTTPLLALNLPNVNLDYSGPVSFSGTVVNTGLGEAHDVALDTSLPGAGVSVFNVGADWTYDAGSGRFTYIGGSGAPSTLANGASSTLSFSLLPSDVCDGDGGGGSVVWAADYTDACGNVYGTPVELSSIAAPSGAPEISLSKTAMADRMEVGEPGSWSMTLSASQRQNILTDPLIVTDVLPAGITGVVPGSPPAGTTVALSGGTLTWTVPKATLASAQSLTVEFNAPSDPCLGGTLLLNTASVVGQSTAGCSLSTSSTASILLTNNPEGGTFDQSFQVGSPTGAHFEAGGPDDGDQTQQAGEGESIPFTASYAFGAGFTGSFDSSSYTDDFGGRPGQVLVAGSLEVQIDGGAFVTLAQGPGGYQGGTGSLTIPLSSISSGPLETHAIVIRYATTIPDAELNGSTDILTQLGTLNIGDGAMGAGSCGVGTYTQGVFVPLARAELDARIDSFGEIDVCEEFPVTLRVSNLTEERASNVLVTLSTDGDYEYLTGQTPAYGGDFAGNITYSENGGNNPTFAYSPATAELDQTSTITVMVRRRAGTGTAKTPLTATVTYDSNGTSSTNAPDYMDGGQRSPTLVREALLAVLVTPDDLTIKQRSASWTVFVSNTGAGLATEVTLANQLPAGLVADEAATNAANPGFPLTYDPVTGLMEWSLGDIASGPPQPIVIVATVDQTECSIPDGSNIATASWGCGGESSQVQALSAPSFDFLEGQLSLLHDTTASQAVLCGTGIVQFQALNVGSGHLYGVEVFEDLDTANTGIAFVNGSAQWSLDGANWNSIADPTITANGLRFDEALIPVLAELGTAASSRGAAGIFVRFSVTASDLASTSARVLNLTGSAVQSCGQAENSPGASDPLALSEPDIRLLVDGSNLDTGSGFSSKVTGIPGESVRWRYRIRNSGDATAENVNLVALFAAHGTSIGNLAGPGIPGTIGYTSGTSVLLSDVPVGESIYTLDVTLGAACVTAEHSAEVTWGCTPASTLNSPSDNSDSATLAMEPDFDDSGLSQQILPLPGGRAEVRVTLANSGGQASNLVLTDTLPAGVQIDASFAPTITNTSGTVGGVALGGSALVPTFALTGSLRGGDAELLTFRVLPTTGFDVVSDAFTIPETQAGGLDPAPPAVGPNQIQLAFNSACGAGSSASDSATLDLATPDLDVTLSPADLVVQPGQNVTFTYTITNVGDTGSIADQAEFAATIGAGWTTPQVEITSSPNGAGGVCAGTCTPLQLGPIAAGQSVTIEVSGTATTGGPLAITTLTRGNLFNSAGADTGQDYSLDGADPKIIGMDLSLSRVSDSLTQTTGSDVAIGEEVTWRLRFQAFGGETLTDFGLRNALPAGFGYVSHTPTGAHSVTIDSLSGNNPVASGTLDFAVADIDTSPGPRLFEVDVVTRTLNLASNTNGAIPIVPLGVSFTAVGESWASDSALDGFGGSEPTLHDQASSTVVRPALEFTKLVRNVTQGEAAFAAATGANAGDVLEYRVVVNNTGTGPAFDVEVDDTLAGTKLELVDGAADGLDNDGDGVTDGGDAEGAFTPGLAGSVLFDEANTLIASGSSFGDLAAGDQLTILYRARPAFTAEPTEQHTNSVTLAASTLPGSAGGQTGSVGSPGDPDGEATLSESASATITIEELTLRKNVVSTSVAGTPDGTVAVGEQVRFELAIVLPQGTIPALRIRDRLPEGLGLVQFLPTQLGSAIAGGQPTTSPGSVPASAAPLVVQWDFGTRVVSTGTVAERTLTIPYLAQVENIAASVHGSMFTNSAAYEYTGSTANSDATVLTVSEPGITVSVGDNAPAVVDAFDVVTYTVTVANAADRTSAYDLDLLATLPAGLAYVPGSTSRTGGPGVGEPELTGNTLHWGRTQTVPASQDLDIDAGQTLSFTFQARLQDSVEPGENLQLDLAVDWTSLDGTPGPNLGTAVAAPGTSFGERTGLGGGVNTATDSDNSDFDVANVYGIAHAASGDTLSPTGFRIGDLATYELTVDVQEGTTDGFMLEHDLPGGLAFADLVSVAPAAGGNFAYTIPAGGDAPAAGDTGTLAFNFGTVVNAGDSDGTNDQLALTFRARILDAAGVANSAGATSLTGPARLDYLDAAGAAQGAGPASATIDIHQPSLSSELDPAPGQPLSVGASEAVRLRFTATNSGSGPAYNTTFQAQLPVGLRQATPTNFSATLNGLPVTLAPPVYTASTGVSTWTLSDGQVLGPASELVLDFDATTDATIGAGATYTATARVTAAFSKPSSDGIERRNYGSTVDATAKVTTEAPAGMGKTASAGTGNIGDEVVFTLSVPQVPVGGVLYDVRIQDSLPAGLALVGFSDNSVALGATVVDGSAGDALDLAWDRIPAGAQAQILVTARVANVASNQAQVNLDNTASFTWASSDGGATETAIPSSAARVTVTEPSLTIDKTFVSFDLQDATRGLQAGDKIRYAFNLFNAGDGVAYGLEIRDLADQDLLNPAVIANPDNPGTLQASTTASGVTTYVYRPAGSLAPGAAYSFDLEFLVGAAVQPGEVLSNTAQVDWHSLSSGGTDGRGATGGLDDYTAADGTPVVVSAGAIFHDKQEASGGDGTYAPGEQVTYDLSFTFPQGQVRMVQMEDQLPSGLVYVSANLTGTDVQQANGAAIALLSQPAAGATGLLSFGLGNIDSAGSGPAVNLQITAYVDNIQAVQDGTGLVNESNLRYEFPRGSGSLVSVPAVNMPQIAVIEPNLLTALEGVTDLVWGTPGGLVMRVDNAGDGIAWQPSFQIQLPTGLRENDPTNLPFQVTISGGRNVVLSEGSDYTLVHDSVSGLLTLALAGSNGFLDGQESLRFEFEVELDENAGDGSTLNTVATATGFASTDGGTAPGTRSYAFAAGSGTIGTAAGDQGDDVGDDHQQDASLPVFDIEKSVGTPVAEAGTTVHYVVTVTNTGTAGSLESVLTDDLPPEFAAGTLANATVDPALGTLTSDPSGGANGTGSITVAGLTLDAGASLTVEFDVELAESLPQGTVVANQARLASEGFADPFLSDSDRPGDNDGTDTGNDPGDGDDDDSTLFTIQSAPALRVAKLDFDDNGNSLEGGDTITYSLTFTNEGNEDATNAVLFDSVPTNTTYVLGSTLLNGQPVVDAGGASPLASGLPVQSAGEPAGRVPVGSSGTVLFQVQIAEGLSNGTVLSNQATIQANGEGSGPVTPVQSDDPDTTAPGDPTESVLGAEALLDALKTVVDENGGGLAPGDALTYSILITNTGSGPAGGVVLADGIPAGTTYVPGSLALDPDGDGPLASSPLSDAADGDTGDFDVTVPGAVTVNIGSLPTGARLVTFRVIVDGGVSGGTVISNQGLVTSTGQPAEATDSDGNDANGDSPTVLVVGSEPALQATKMVADLNGETVVGGDTLTYIIVVRNVGAADATGVVVTDPLVPSLTDYVPGSTRLGGFAVPDVGGQSPLLTGVAAGTIAPGEQAVLRFSVQVQGQVPAGAIIDNQATWSSNNAGSGVTDSDLDDGLEGGNDPGNPNDDDPTRVQVGGAPGSATVSGFVYEDTDHDRTQGPGEEPVEGWLVELSLNGVVIDETLTVQDGSYSFTGLAPGSGYSLRFRHPDTGTIYGNPSSNTPGTSVQLGAIVGLQLFSGSNVLNQSLPLDPSGVVYDAIRRTAVPNVLASLRGPVGFDPAIHLVPGQQDQVTGADGRYRFDLVGAFPAGVYSLEFTPPSGFLPTFPSAFLPVEPSALDPTGLPDPFEVAPFPGAPQQGQSTLYYVDFDLAAGDPNVVNNHVPLDPAIQGAVVVTKTTPKTSAVRGELIPYDITVTNTLSSALAPTDVMDETPPGFKYVAGSAQVDGMALEPTIAGRTLTWPALPFAANQVYQIRLLMVVGAGVSDGEYENRAWAQDASSGFLLSDVAGARVSIVPDGIFDCTDLIGKVFDDRDGDGFQDEGEPGIPGVRLATAQGLLVTTDAWGRYHIACADVPDEMRGSNFILKVDPRTLPSGYAITTENPRVVRMTRGKMVKANFGARLAGDLQAKEAQGKSMSAEQGADLDLLEAGVQVRYDGLAVRPSLNVNTWPEAGFTGQPSSFQAHANYRLWIDRMELRLFPEGTSERDVPMRIVPFDELGFAEWTPPADAPEQLRYVLRVYDADGRYDETRPKSLRVLRGDWLEPEGADPSATLLAGYGENHRLVSGIPVVGGAVTVNGQGLGPDELAYAFGLPVPIDSNGSFAVQQIVTHGSHKVPIRIDGPASSRSVQRIVHVPDEDWFYVALADLTVGTGSSGGAAALVTGDDNLDDDVFVNGRLAFYAKGKIKGEYLLTASLDTRDEPIEDILDNLDQKDPRQLLRRINPDQHYPVYGDDSTTVQDAPTQGRFYVRLERDDFHVMWGSFVADQLDTDLAQFERGLYGLKAHWHDREVSASGEAVTKADVFLAEPGTVPAREEFRGTGGSLYFLQHTDLTQGSERLRIEVRDRDSGIVLETTPLAPNQDYEIDYLQGRVILESPLASTAGDGLTVQTTSITGHPVYLVVRYEYTPLTGDFDSLAAGGRASHWLTDHVRVGVTADHQDQLGGDQNLLGLDLILRKSETTYLKVEGAHSEGPGFGAQSSVSGGFLFDPVAGTASEDDDGTALRVEGSLDLLGNGRLTGYYEDREGGFSGPGLLTTGDTTRFGIAGERQLSKNTSVRLEFDGTDALGRDSSALDAELEHKLNERWTLNGGLRWDDFAGQGSLTGRTGSRADGAIKLGFDTGQDWDLYGFGQLTLDRDGTRSANNRYGLGGSYAITDRLRVGGELSGGNGGLGANVKTEFQKSDATSVYLGYQLDADNTDSGFGSRNGAVVLGAKTRYSESLSVFGEERLQHGEGPSGLVHAYGLEYSPAEAWTTSVEAEVGNLASPLGGAIEREAVSVGLGYTREKARWTSAVEYREDESGAGEQTTWLLRNGGKYSATPTWSLLGRADLARTDGAGGGFFQGEFTELSIGAARRPVDNDFWNMLLRYTYFEDVPTPGQTNAAVPNATLLDYAQRSHVLAIDLAIDVIESVTLGAKVGYRRGEARLNKDAGEWFDSEAILTVLRGDLHVIKAWDAYLEWRSLEVKAARDRRDGWLIGIHRHVGDHLRIGVGFNFTDFSDDLTDLDYDHRGWFINLTGKF